MKTFPVEISAMLTMRVTFYGEAEDEWEAKSLAENTLNDDIRKMEYVESSSIHYINVSDPEEDDAAGRI